MTRTWLASAVLLMGLSVSAFADATGTWTGSLSTPDGQSFELSFTLKQDGGTLTGAAKGPQGNSLPISNGKADGDKVTFSIDFNGQFTIQYSGVIKGDAMDLTIKSDAFPESMVKLKKAS